jgi:hypothetical protein
MEQLEDAPSYRRRRRCNRATRQMDSMTNKHKVACANPTATTDVPQPKIPKEARGAKEVSQIHHIQSTKTHHIHAQLQKEEARAKVAEDKESK